MASIKTDTGAVLEVRDEEIADEILTHTNWQKANAPKNQTKKQKAPDTSED